MGIVLRFLATHPDEWVEIDILVEEVYGEGASGNQLGGELGSFTRRVKRRYGKEKWPFEARYDEDQWKYRMDARTAEVIRRIVGLYRLQENLHNAYWLLHGAGSSPLRFFVWGRECYP